VCLLIESWVFLFLFCVPDLEHFVKFSETTNSRYVAQSWSMIYCGLYLFHISMSSNSSLKILQTNFNKSEVLKEMNWGDLRLLERCCVDIGGFSGWIMRREANKILKWGERGLLWWIGRIWWNGRVLILFKITDGIYVGNFISNLACQQCQRNYWLRFFLFHCRFCLKLLIRIFYRNSCWCFFFLLFF